LENLHIARGCADHRIADWAERMTPARLAGDVTWFSGATLTAMRRPFWLLVTHTFNHQTYHRSQLHALLTGLGQSNDATGLPLAADTAALGSEPQSCDSIGSSDRIGVRMRRVSVAPGSLPVCETRPSCQARLPP